jgi:hypothetical protein
MPTITVYTKAEAKAADAKLAELTTIAQGIEQRVGAIADRAVSATGASMAFLSGGRKGMSLDGRTAITWADVMAVAVGELAPRRFGDRNRVAALVAEHKSVAAEHREAHAAVRAWDEANYKGWQRFFLVPDGHIHAWTGCSSLRITTKIGWLPDLSGETEAEAVAAHGAMLCTKCFPSAPVEWTRGREDDPSKCNGAPDAATRRGRYAKCRECGFHGALTSNGNLRKHTRKMS